MKQLLAIAAGGALGSVLRFITSKVVQNWFGGNFPVGILAVNVIGSLLAGFLAILLIDRFSVTLVWKAMILVGFLGGFTTFSSFSINAVNLLRDGTHMSAFLYIVSSVVLSLSAAWAGVLLGRLI